MNPFDQFDSPAEANPFDQFDDKPKKRKPVDRNAFAVANDTVIEAANAVAGGVGSIANFVAPGNRVSKFIDENIVKAGEQSQSDAVKAEKQRLSEEIQAAGGVLDEAKAAASYAARNPLLSAAQAAGSFALPGGAIKAAGAGAAKALGTKALEAGGKQIVQRVGLGGGVAAGMALGGGDAAGTAYELSKKGGATDEQAVEAARKASVIPAIISGAGALVGAERLVAGAKGFTGNLASRALKTGAVEAVQEGVEEGVTQYEGQRAAVPYNPGLDPMKGVGAAATTGAILGAATGGGVSALQGGAQPVNVAAPAVQAPQAVAPEQAPTTPTQQPPSEGPQQAAPAMVEARLAELEIVAAQRELTPAERTEAEQLIQTLEAENVSAPDAPSAVAGDGGQQQRVEPGPGMGVARPGADNGVRADGDSATGVVAVDAAPAPVRDGAAEQVADLTENVQQINTSAEPVQKQAEFEQVAPQDAPVADLQNRDRSRVASVQQMAAIARDPDYMRLGPSRTPDSGAPMVFAVADDARQIPADAMGRNDVAVMADGQRVPFRYAVVDASKVNPSNFADGRNNPAFTDATPGTIKALNNGRTAGLRAAHELGSAGRYAQELIADQPSHGVPAEVIARTPNPMLVRVYSERDNTPGMAAKSQGQGLGMSPGELARQDAPLMDSRVLSAYQPGDVGSAANRDFTRAFVGKLMQSGQDVAGMITDQGTLSPAGRQRMQAALMQAAYGDSALVEEMFDSLEPDVKAIGEALKSVAGEWANMRDAARTGAIHPEADVTGNLMAAVGMVRKARQERSSLYDASRQTDLLTGDAPDALTIGMLRTMYGGKYLTRALGKDKVEAMLRGYVDAAMSTSADAGLFGDPVTPGEIIATITGQGELDGQTTTQTSQREPAGGINTGGRVVERSQGQQQPGDERSGNGPAETGRVQPPARPDQGRQQARAGDQEAAKGDEAAGLTRFSRSTSSADEQALEYISQQSDVFSLPKSKAKDLESIIAENMPGLTFKKSKFGDLTTYKFTLPDGTPADMSVRPPNPYGPVLYGWDKGPDGEMTNIITERPGENAEAMGGKTDVWIDVSRLKSGELGQAIYNIAATYAHNNGMVFIGDPNGLSDIALRRRTENMLNSALKFGTTEHLGPHPRQADGDKAEGVPPLRWVYGDHVGNIERMIDVSIKSAQNADYVQPAADYIPASEASPRSGTRGRLVDSNGSQIGRRDLQAAAEFGPNRQAGIGRRTLARLAIFESLLQRAGEGSAEGGRAGGGKGILARFAGIVREFAVAEPGSRIFYSRGDIRSGLTTEAAQAAVDSVTSKWANAPEIVVVQDMQDSRVPEQARLDNASQQSQNAQGDPEGFYLGGKVYVVAGALKTEADVARVVFHEVLGHAGLRGAFGDALNPILIQIAAVRGAEVRAKAKQYGIDATTKEGRLEAAEEVLAEMAQTQPELGFVRRAVAAVRSWLRANVPVLADLKLTDDEIVRNYLLPARGFIERGREAAATEEKVDPPAASVTRYSRSTMGDTTPPPVPPKQQTRVQKLKAKALQLASPETIDGLIYQFQDKFIDLKRVQAHIKALGGVVTDLNDAYLGEELYHKRVAKRTEDFLATELKPLLAEMRAKAVKHTELEQFLHARHAPEANKAMAQRNPAGEFQGTEAERLSLSGMSDAEAKAIMDSLAPEKRKALDSLAARVDAINAKTMAELEKYGLMDKASLDAWRKAYEFYVPLHRDEAHPDSASHPVGQGFSVKGDASKRRVGSNEKVTHILGHVAMQREAALTRGEKNNVAKKLYLLASQNPDPNLWSVDKVPKVKTVGDNGVVRESPDPMFKMRPNVVVVRIAGKDAAIVFNERNPQALRMAEAIKNQDATELGWLLTQSAKVTRYFSMINTQLNPIFGIVNFIRDVQGAALNLSSTPLAGKQAQVAKHLFPALRAVYRQERGKGAANEQNAEYIRLWNDLQDTGGATGYRALYQTAEDRVDALEAELKKDDAGAARKVFDATLDWLSDYNEAMENSTRVAVYKVALEQGMTKERAASVAKNITVNFNRKGRMGSQIGAGYAFFNAAVQGTTRMVQTLTGPAGRKIIGGGLAVGMLNTLMGMAVMGAGEGEDDDEWAKIPDFVKERNLIIPLGREDYITIPMPLGFHALPNLGRLATELALMPDKTAGKQAGKALGAMLDAFNPLGGGGDPGQTIMPTVLDPAWALATNKDWTGKPIYREDMNKLDPTPGHTRAKESASTFSKFIAEKVNAATGGNEYRPGAVSWTPDQIDYIVGQLTGGIGREAMKLEQSITSTVTGDELPSYKVPLLGRLYGNTRGPANQSAAFYDNARELNEIENEIQGRAKAGEDIGEFMEREPLSKLVGAGNAAERQIAALRKQRRLVIQQGGDDSKAQAEEINAQIGAVMGGLNREMARVRREGQ